MIYIRKMWTELIADYRNCVILWENVNGLMNTFMGWIKTFKLWERWWQYLYMVSCNDYKLLERIMPFEAGPASSGYSAPYYNMVYAMTYHDDEVGKKAQAELSTFMEKKRTQFDLK